MLTKKNNVGELSLECIYKSKPTSSWLQTFNLGMIASQMPFKKYPTTSILLYYAFIKEL